MTTKMSKPNFFAFLCLIFLGLLLPVTVTADELTPEQARRLDSIRTVRKQKIFQFTDSRYPIGYKIDTLKNIPTELRGENLARGLTQTDPVEAAYEFLEQNKEIFGIKNAREELKVEGMSFKKYGGMVVLKQFYNGLPVSGGEIIVRFTPSSKALNGIDSRFQPEIDAISAISTNPSIDSSSAIEIAKRDLGYKGDKADSIFQFVTRDNNRDMHKTPSPYLVILPHEKQYRLTWVVTVDAAKPRGIWEYFIDANTGNVLNRWNHLIVDGFNRPSNSQGKSSSPPPEGTAKSAKPTKNVPIIPADTTKVVPVVPPEDENRNLFLEKRLKVNQEQTVNTRVSDSTSLPRPTSGGQPQPANLRDFQTEVENEAVLHLSCVGSNSRPMT